MKRLSPHRPPPSVRLDARVLLLVGLLAACGGPPPDPPIQDPESPAPPPAAPGLFVDQAAASGLRFTHFNGMTGDFLYSEMMGSGVALFDADRDGDLDAFLIQGRLQTPGKTLQDAILPPMDDGPLVSRIFLNDPITTPDGSRQPRFTPRDAPAATGYGMGVTVLDFDNDGWLDLYLTNAGPNQLLRGRGDGTFEDVTATSGSDEKRWSVAAVPFDFDADGWLDLYIGNYVDYSPSTDKPCIDPLGGRDYCGPHAYAPLTDRLLRNRGDGTFEDATARAGLSERKGATLGAVAADFNADGHLDLYVANDGTPNFLWLNQGDGTFEESALLAGCAVNGLGHAEAGMGVAAADFDGDGDEDLFVTHLARETNTLYVNDGQGFFEDRSTASGLGAPSLPWTGFGTAFIDFDQDGWLDQLTVNGAVRIIQEQRMAGDPLPLKQPGLLLRNLGDGTFDDVSSAAGADLQRAAVSRGAAFGDVDNDGDIDVLVSENSGPARLLINRTDPPSESWLGLELRTGNDRVAFGAAVVLELHDGRALRRRVGGNASYASSSDPRLHFGLAGSGGPLRATVLWTDGRRETWHELPTGQYLILRQGQGTAPSP